ncbi:senescence-associated protein [Striga asiatica]|uniref:Senescence-associated protein n=1 Tax=Striga asiatica TaxID=4170 RepID=A0A5A7P159_STRAF|nr:senescence-associated protein [Striga asiatica]
MAKLNGVIYSSEKLPHLPKLSTKTQRVSHKQSSLHHSASKLKFSSKGLWPYGRKIYSDTLIGSRGSPLVCQSTETHNTETRKRMGHFGDCSNTSSTHGEDESSMETVKNISSGLGLAEACKYVSNDAKFVNERARSDIVLLSRGIMKLDARARQDVAFLGSEFLKLDARAKEDTVKVDHNVKRKAERLHHVASILKNIAQSRLKSAADKHWNNGALEDMSIWHANIFPSLDLSPDWKVIHLLRRKVSKNNDEVASRITLEKNGKTLGFFPGEVSTDRINAIQEAYWSIASALSEADGIDYTDPEELELLVAALIDLDAMDGKSSVSLLAERALANALSAAPSMWTLGNAGMGALQRLAEDSNPAIAAAASRTINELKKQWEIEEEDSWRFMLNQTLTQSQLNDDNDEKEDDDTCGPD